jgi:hypothetical protein
MATYRKNEKKGLIGLSLSFCVGEMVRNNISEGDVQKIVTSTRAPDRDIFLDVCNKYAKSYWNDCAGKAIALAMSMYDNGKIEQPRCEGKPCHTICNGHWADDESDIDTSDWWKYSMDVGAIKTTHASVFALRTKQH